ncbi:MAG TPA: MFS transporter [Noviherbaspirillum sp.]|uniref:MFS transporter n=1 Tax=Noviherbaspirillum sp. TaxID=1926288 RepID=UPI002F92A3EF
MNESQRKRALPLALLTAVGMLSSDLYLPALPAMVADIGVSLVEGQATMAVFLMSLALSQLAWGWLADHFGDRAAIFSGIWLLIGGSLACALAPNIEWMLFGRLLQGLGSGAATVAVPALIRRRFGETDAVGALAMVATLESIVPAAAPVLGVALLGLLSWRTSFVLIAVAAFILLFFAGRIVGHVDHPDIPARGAPTWATVANGRFLRHCAAYACMFGALLMFVSSAPILVTHWYAQPVTAFAALQVCGVLAFMVGARQGTRSVARLGIAALIRRGTLAQACAGAVMLACAAADFRSMAGLCVAWAMFCWGLGMRGPSSMSRALSLVRGGHGKAAGLLMFSAFAATSVATMAVAPWLEHGLLPVALLLTALVAASTALVPELFLGIAGRRQES